MAFQVGRSRDTGERGEGRINVEEFCWATAAIYGDAGAGKDERHAGGALPEGVFAGDAFLAKMPTVVGPEHDDGIVGFAARFERIEESTDLGVDEADGGEVGAHEGFPLVRLFEKTQARFGEFPMQIPRETRCIVSVVGEHGRELQRLFRVEIEPLLGGVAGHMGTTKSDGVKERRGVGLVRLGAEGFDAPRGGNVVALELV
jgi:hypothetical protein